LQRTRQPRYLDPITGIDTKVCKTCGEAKPVTAFGNKGGPVTGKHYPDTDCRECRTALQAASRQADPERFRSYAQTDQRNRDKYVERKREERAAEPERVRAILRKSQTKHRDKRRTEAKAYDATHRPEKKQYNHAYRETNREELNAYDRTRLQSDPDRQESMKNHRAKRRAQKQTTQVADKIRWKFIIERDKSTCYICHRTLTEKEITFDHVIPLAKGGPHIEENIRVACGGCNSRKGTKLPAELGLCLF